MEKVIHICSADIRTCRNLIKTSKRYIKINLVLEYSRVLGEGGAVSKPSSAFCFVFVWVCLFVFVLGVGFVFWGFFLMIQQEKLLFQMFQIIVVTTAATLLNLPCLVSFHFIWELSLNPWIQNTYWLASLFLFSLSLAIFPQITMIAQHAGCCCAADSIDEERTRLLWQVQWSTGFGCSDHEPTTPQSWPHGCSTLSTTAVTPRKVITECCALNTQFRVALTCYWNDIFVSKMGLYFQTCLVWQLAACCAL